MPMARPLHRLRFWFDHRWVPQHASDYLDSELGVLRRGRVERHTVECPECRELLHGLRAVIGALGKIGGAESPVVAEAVLASIRGRLGEHPREHP
jgi:anti-sigma factor RsiW